MHIRLIITSMDTLHSFALPSLGVKVDAVPGRLNTIDVFIYRMGIFYGQCSEICGVGHGFMPICLHAISFLNFLIGDL
jgi:cytochrome c oxidase subunit 2